MNKRLSLLAGALILCFTGCAQKQSGDCYTNNAQTGSNELSIAFYNCENFFDTVHEAGKDDEEFTPEGKYRYTQRIYTKKQHNIATAIANMGDTKTPDGPALIGLAEVENNVVLNDLIHQPELADKHYKYEWFDGPDKRGINVALLYNPKYFRVLKAEPLHVDLTGTEGKADTRDVLYVYGVLAGDTVSAFVNHWPSRRGEEEAGDERRAIAAKVVKNKMDALVRNNPHAKVIVMGDLNDNPVDASVTQVLGAKETKEETEPTGLYNPWIAVYKNGEGTEEYKHKWNLFDQIIVSGSFLKGNSWQFDKAMIFKPDFLVDHYKYFDGYPHRSFLGTYWINGYSDHFPVILYLTR